MEDLVIPQRIIREYTKDQLYNFMCESWEWDSEVKPKDDMTDEDYQFLADLKYKTLESIADHSDNAYSFEKDWPGIIEEHFSK